MASIPDLLQFASSFYELDLTIDVDTGEFPFWALGLTFDIIGVLQSEINAGGV